MNESWTRRLNTAANIALLVTLGVVIAHPRGPIVPTVLDWKAERDIRRTLGEVWPELAGPAYADSMVNAPKVLVVFSDYQCPACRAAEARLPELQDRIGFAVTYRHLPIRALHPAAEGAARAAICAELQGHFKEMHARLFETRAWETTGDWIALAADVGVPDVAMFAGCLQDEATTLRLQQDLDFASRLRITATPSFVGPKRMNAGVPNDQSISALFKD